MQAFGLTSLANGAKKVTHRLANVFTVYDIFQARTSSFLASAVIEDDAHRDFSVIKLDTTHLEVIDRHRPKYASMARHYLAENHVGLAVLADGEIASMGWLAENVPGGGKILGYYSLPDGCVWLHAAWTSPRWRGKGFHKLLIRERARYALTHGSVPDPILECNIESSNSPSIQNYERLGFEKRGRLLVIRFPFCPTFAWRFD